MSRGKKYKEAFSKVDRDHRYEPNAALKLLKETAYGNFDETVEVHFNLGIDPRHADQQLRGTLSLPHGNGKEVRVAVITQGEKVKEAQDAGANEVGGEDLIEKIQKGWFEFDLLITSPDMMGKVGKLGRTLGAKGLMPNPKSGTVTPNIGNAVKEFKAGKLEYRNDKNGIIHIGIGKVSFDQEKLAENFMMVYDTLLKIKPSKAKGTYMNSISLSTTQGVGIFVEPAKMKWENNE